MKVQRIRFFYYFFVLLYIPIRLLFVNYIYYPHVFVLFLFIFKM